MIRVQITLTNPLGKDLTLTSNNYLTAGSHTKLKKYDTYILGQTFKKYSIMQIKSY